MAGLIDVLAKVWWWLTPLMLVLAAVGRRPTRRRPGPQKRELPEVRERPED